MKKLIYIIFLAAAFNLSAYAQISNTVTFKADITELLEQGFTPGVNTLKVEGLNWDNSAISVDGDRQMSQDPNNPNIYLTVLTIYGAASTVPGDSARYKIKGGPDADFMNGGWEGGDPVTNYDGRAFVFGADKSSFDVGPVVPRLEMIQKDNLLENTVTFQADIGLMYGSGSGYFDPANGDILEVKGFWSNSADTNIIEAVLISGDPIMQSHPLNPTLYTTTLVIGIPNKNTEGKGTGFKFKASPDDHFSNTGWEVSPNRDYFFSENGAEVVLDPVVPDIHPAKGALTSDVTALFQVHLVEGSRNRYDNSVIPIDEVQYVILKGAPEAMGNWQGSWTTADTAQAVVLNDSGLDGDKTADDNIWSATLTFAAGTQQGFSPYKYGVYYPGCESVPGASGAYLDNSAPSGADLSFNITESSTVIEVLDIWPTVISSVEEISGAVPEEYALSQNYPNPFNPATKIRYSLKESGSAKVDIYNALGEHVMNLVDLYQDAGSYEITFNASQLTSGIYFYTIKSGNYTASKKMIYLK